MTKIEAQYLRSFAALRMTWVVRKIVLHKDFLFVTDIIAGIKPKLKILSPITAIAQSNNLDLLVYSALALREF